MPTKPAPKGSRKEPAPPPSEEFDNFEELTRALLKVSKRELAAAITKEQAKHH